MPQSLAHVVVHIVFSTKHRRTWLVDEGIRSELHKYLAQILATIDCPGITIGGVADHVHILCNLSRKITIMGLIEELKTASSKWLKTKGQDFQDFYWQGGYGAFSVSESKVPEVREYVDNQEQHHQRLTFQEEFRLLCERHKMRIDDRYVWD
ncbi:MAG: IS200/IS605 family transposase [Planctomycetota bacterium]